MRTLEVMWDPHMGLVGSACENHGGTPWLHQRRGSLADLVLLLESFIVFINIL